MTLNEIVKAISLLDERQAVVERIEEELKGARERARLLREETIPSMMQEIGISKLTLEDGREVSVKQDVYARIPAEKYDKAILWLLNNGHGSICRAEVSLSFPKGEADEAIKLHGELHERNYNSVYKESVHPQTLKAFLKEQIANGADVPLDLFGAYPVWKTRIK